MMIRTTAKSVYYPISGQRAAVIRESARVRYVRGSLLVNPKYFLTAKRLNDRGPVSVGRALPSCRARMSEDALPSLVEAH
jgi:hypothetical protein